MPTQDLEEWIAEQSASSAIWYAKRLSGNDTLANDAHQAGPYVPRDLLFRLFPALNTPTAVNPDHWFDLYVDSHADHKRVRAVWYNGRVRSAGTRNETRLTNLGGGASPLLNADSTGALAVFSFALSADGTAADCHVWVCDNEIEAELFEERLGPVEPGRHVIWSPGVVPQDWDDYFGLLGLMRAPSPRASCFLSPSEIPPEWLVRFPSGATIIRRAVEMARCAHMAPDARLLKRRLCEFEIFQSVEQEVFLPRVRGGFNDLDAFLRVAQSVLQSRKSRSGKSLELHAKEILIEEGFSEGSDFCHDVEIEGGKRPDFVFPSKSAYLDPEFPSHRLRMLAAKTTCKDRWRQVLNEADRIPTKHLLTLQEGVSEGQFQEMTEAGVRLVVPSALQGKYPQSVQAHLTSLETFIAEVHHLRE